MRKLAIALTVGLAVGYALAQRQAAAERAELAELKAKKETERQMFVTQLAESQKFRAQMKNQDRWIQEAIEGE